MITPGVYSNLSNEDYHAAPAVSRSGLMMFNESPYKYWAHYINPKRPQRKETEAMKFGSAFHTFVLEPELFEKYYGIMPEKVLLKDVGREEYEQYKLIVEKLNLSTKILLTPGEVETLYEMKRALMEHSQAWDLISDAVYEQSYFWENKESGLILKARPDILHSNMIVDLKTCANASTRAFEKAMGDSGYHVQGAMCIEAQEVLKGHKIETVINICIEKTYPYSIGIKVISPEALKAGKEFFLKKALELNRAIVDNKFDDYTIEIANLPRWYNE